MKPQLLKVSKEQDNSFSIRHDLLPYFINRWHYHPEIELIYIKEGQGTEFIGDSIRNFNAGDILLIGSCLPHFWRCDEIYFQGNPKLRAVATVAHFREDFWGAGFLELAENKKIRELLARAKRGIVLTGKAKNNIAELLKLMLNAEDTERIILLLKALHEIARSKNTKTVSSTGFQPASLESRETERINKIYKYSLEHFKEKISLKEIAAEANISQNSFCRYFKLHTRKTYNSFLQELRVGHASKLLIENRLSITQICYESGFNNITNFYKSFKKITGKTPLEYQKTFKGTEG